MSFCGASKICKRFSCAGLITSAVLVFIHLNPLQGTSDTFQEEAEFQNLIVLAVVNLHKAGDWKLGQKIKDEMILVTLKSKVNLLTCSGSLHLFLHKQVFIPQ